MSAAEKFVERGGWVSHLVLMEATRVLTSVYEVGAPDLAMAIDMLLKHRNLTVQDSDVVAAALQHFQEKPAAGFSDCLVLEVARKEGHLPLGTFDKHLGRLDGAQRIS